MSSLSNQELESMLLNSFTTVYITELKGIKKTRFVYNDTPKANATFVPIFKDEQSKDYSIYTHIDQTYDCAPDYKYSVRNDDNMVDIFKIMSEHPWGMDYVNSLTFTAHVQSKLDPIDMINIDAAKANL